jgi:hypothetical protein
MNIILTSDVELWSWRKNFKRDIEEGVLKLIELAEKERIPITFFISLTDKGYGIEEYSKKISDLVKKIKSKKVFFGIHPHCRGLDLDFIKSDNLKEHSEEEIVKILSENKKELEKITNREIRVHRAGNYGIPRLDILNRVFKKTGLLIDSSDISIGYSQITKLPHLIEIPPATSKEYSKKSRVWTPEQMSLKEILNFYNKSKNKTEVLVINFHSFSVYGNISGKRIWYFLPLFLRNFLRPLIKKIKKSPEESRISENFEKLYKLVRFLKKQGDKFTYFEEYLNGK